MYLLGHPKSLKDYRLWNKECPRIMSCDVPNESEIFSP